MFGETYRCETAALALVEILRKLAARDSSRLPALAEAVRGRSRSLIARTVQEINPLRPDLARAVEFAPGWLIGLSISNAEKMQIVRKAAKIYEMSLPSDLDLVLPNG